MKALSKGISWWANWAPAPETAVASIYQALDVSFVPMAWGGTPTVVQLNQQIPQGAKYLLGFNEPNFISQANKTPTQAAALWPVLESVARTRDLQIGSPSVNYSGDPVSEGGVTFSDPVAYLDAFLAACAGCKIDFIPVHWYACDVPALKAYVDRFRKYNKPIWITEFACGDRPHEQITVDVQRAYMTAAVKYLESEPAVARYAWFSGRNNAVPNANLLGADGELTELGDLYVELGGAAVAVPPQPVKASTTPTPPPGVAAAPVAAPVPQGTTGQGLVTPAYVPLFADDTQIRERLQYTEADGTLVTMIGMRPTERHARERGESWFEADKGQGRYLTFPTFYFQNRTFGLEIRDSIPAGGKKIEVRLHVNEGTFEGTTFSMFRSLNADAFDYGWNLNYYFPNAAEGGKNICHEGRSADCTMNFDANWRTDPHSPLKIGDRIELAPAPFLPHDANFKALVDGGGPRYYSFEQLYVVGVGVQPWYGIEPRLDSAPLPEATLLGGQTTLSYNYSDEANRVFQQMANNIGIDNTREFVRGRRLFHTSFIDGKHSEHPDDNPVFSAHIGQVGPRFNGARCIGCHTSNGRSVAPAIGAPLATMSVLTAAAGTAGAQVADPNYGFNVQQLALSSSASDFGVSLLRNDVTVRALPSGERIELVKPVYAFKSTIPAFFSVRQAPQVIGMGLIEALSESTLLALADPNDTNGDGVRGIPSWNTDPETGQTRLGRYGWKAQTVSLRHQLGDALIKDIGVTSPVFPSRSCQRGAADCRTPDGSAGVTESEIRTLSNYMALIAVPAQRSLRSGYPVGVTPLPGHDINSQQIAAGSKLFADAQCVACHTPTLKTGNTHPLGELRNQVIHPYSNFMLHDMGPDLADNLKQGNAAAAMWRTAPLWGIGSLRFVQGGADKARYLHDGRARTLTEAVLWHGGEANNSRTRFEALSVTDRAAVIAFLESL
ncbi:hypothetical protein GCM10022212_34900 [Actimicrobium antarcticum]|uniref:Cytochrome c domain-containing protein n=2 Tax=Actimicrobium antarcticum TaxID=1051899 RepID=A0ABP7TYD7_9BURK